MNIYQRQRIGCIIHGTPMIEIKITTLQYAYIKNKIRFRCSYTTSIEFQKVFNLHNNY